MAGILAALFGRSNLKVSGPTGAMTVALVPIAAQYRPGGVLTVRVLAGLILLVLALLRAGRYVRYVPAPVVESFTVGIAAAIFLQQVPAALGVPNPDRENVTKVAWRGLVEFGGDPNWPALVSALGVATVFGQGVANLVTHSSAVYRRRRRSPALRSTPGPGPSRGSPR